MKKPVKYRGRNMTFTKEYLDRRYLINCLEQRVNFWKYRVVKRTPSIGEQLQKMEVVLKLLRMKQKDLLNP